MSKMKKIVSLMLTLVMVLTMSVTAFATEPTSQTYEITITYDQSGHTYEAYQVFTGDLDSTGEILSNVVWGSGVNGSNLITALKSDTTVVGTNSTDGSDITVSSLFSACTTAADVAKVLSDNNTNAALAEQFAQLASENLTNTVTGTSTGGTTADQSGNYTYTISGLVAGYYLVKDQDNSVTGDDAYTDIILEVVDDVDVTAKADTTVLDKAIADSSTDASAAGSNHEDDTTADYDVGDDVPFTLTATLPSTYDDYKTYKLIFHDTLSSGLTFNNDVVVTVYADASDKTGTVVDNSCYSVVSDSTKISDGCTFEVQITDTNSLKVKDATGTAITVTKDSTVVVSYTAKLNDAAKTTLTQTNEASVEYTNNPNDNGSGTGETPKDITTVFTFSLTADKIDEDGSTLSGAGFTLYKAEEAAITEFAAGMTYYTLSTNGLMTKVAATEAFDDTKTYYVYSAVGSELTGTTSFNFSGLGVGYYKLVETTTPDGYNTMEDLYFTIEAVTAEAADGTASVTSLVIKDADGNTISSESSGETFIVSLTSQTIDTDITNYKGSTLPSTGGIGTTIFYIIGGILVAGAAILLITRRRMKSA